MTSLQERDVSLPLLKQNASLLAFHFLPPISLAFQATFSFLNKHCIYDAPQRKENYDAPKGNGGVIHALSHNGQLHGFLQIPVLYGFYPDSVVVVLLGAS